MNATISEIQRLEEIKDKLVQKTYKLRDELNNAEENLTRNRRIPVDQLAKLSDKPTGNSNSPIDKGSTKLNETLQSIFGVQFVDVESNWSHDNVYRYNCHVVTKAIQFGLELVVNVKDNGEDVVEDINCHFANSNQSYLEEITPWVQRFTREKHFSYLISALSDYSDQNIIRAKILSSIKSKGYISLDKCNDDGGGILIHVHPPKVEDKIFFKIQWYTRFVDKTWRIEHIFAIDPVDADEEFIRDHEELLQSFCRIGLKKHDLEELWKKLCGAIDEQ